MKTADGLNIIVEAVAKFLVFHESIKADNVDLKAKLADAEAKLASPDLSPDQSTAVDKVVSDLTVPTVDPVPAPAPPADVPPVA